jgi:hypothetical protein
MLEQRKLPGTIVRTIASTAFALNVLIVGVTAGAVDITGTWQGKEKCKCFNNVDGKLTQRFQDNEMSITQSGTDLNMLAFGTLFNGNVINDPTKDNRGEASFIACDSNPKDNASFGEIGRAKLRTKENGEGKFKVESLWNSSQTQICTCKWNFKRVSTDDPLVAACP